MKRFALIVVIMGLLATMNLSAQYIEDLDGYEWLTWTGEMQRMYLVGFYAAHTSIRWRIEYEMAEVGTLNRETIADLMDFFFISDRVNDLRNAITRYYLSNNRSDVIIHVLNYLVGFYDL